MAELRAWIRARREQGWGTLHLSRAQALAEAASREGVDEITVLTDEDGSDFLREHVPDDVKLATISNSLTPEQEAAHLIELVKPYVPARVDSRHPRPLIYLCGHRYDHEFQRKLWKAGAEVVVIADEAAATHADWFVLGKPYGGELGIPSVSGYTRFLRGSHYAPLPMRAIKAVYQHHTHRTHAQHFAIATENLDIDAWLPKIGEALARMNPPANLDGAEFAPSVTLLPGVDCPSDEELRQKLGGVGSMPVTFPSGRRDVVRELLEADVVFAPDGLVLQQVLALGTVRVALPRKGAEGRDRMVDHLIRREASPAVPALDAADFAERMDTLLQRVCFDPAYRQGQHRIGQYLCDGIGSFRIVRQTAYKVYAVPQNIIRFFELGDPMIPDL